MPGSLYSLGSAVVSGGGGGAPAWTAVVDLDLTGLDTLAMAGSGTTVYSLTKSSVAQVSVTTSTNATSYDFSAGAAGVTYNTMSGTGTATVGFDLTTAFSKTGDSSLVWDDWSDPVAVQLLVTGVTWGAAVQDLVAGLGEFLANPATSTVSFAWRGVTDTVDTDWKVRRYTTTSTESTVSTNVAFASSYVLTLIIHAGIVTELWYQPGATSIPADPRAGTGPYSAGYTSVSNGAMPVILQAFVPFFGVIRGGGGTDWAGTLAGLRVSRFEVTA